MTPTEWGRFALWLKDQKLSPAQLLQKNLSKLLASWQDKNITFERIKALLERGNAMALALEKWQRAGVWVITRSDDCYPKRLKARLGTLAPPLFFGVGNQDLLNQGGLAVVGSRNASPVDLAFTDAVGAKCASNGICIVSGGARGVDETSMLGAVNAHGTSIGVMADSLLKAAMAKKWRSHLASNNLVLISPFYPEAGFNAGNAMARNKYVYCIADGALVVHSGIKGGTWSGALENLKKDWVPLWVKPTEDRAAGNADIVNQGAHWCNNSIDEVVVTDLFIKHRLQPTQAPTLDLWGAEERSVSQNKELESYSSVSTVGSEVGESQPNLPEQEGIQAANDSKAKAAPKIQDEVVADADLTACREPDLEPLYDFFLKHLHSLCSTPIAPDEISQSLGLHNSQVKEWLMRAVEEGILVKKTRPVRFQWSELKKTIPKNLN
ncbi:DNA-processing protein DprA [Endozoicomonas montiporae]|uniref:DNA-processing protein DprA n=1 Tax=Endozoicomonas montiporae TaxID=1027273 RepID=UPI001C9DAA26|nr:DNA-processing protein DprA [Endozoicomonas montiporae]